MHRTLAQELTARLPKGLSASQINTMARMAEMTLDGMMIALVMRTGPKEMAETKRAWAGFVDLLLASVGAE